MYSSVDTIWVLLGATLVFFMQAGFAMVETGLTRAKVKLLDTGHTHGTFLTQEFGYQLARSQASLLKVLVFVIGFGLPGLMLVWVFNAQGGQALALVAAVAGLLGAAMERWLFFAEARHVVNLYHGAQRC